MIIYTHIVAIVEKKIAQRGKTRLEATKWEDETGFLWVNEGRSWISLPRVRDVQIVFTRLLSRGSRCCVIFLFQSTQVPHRPRVTRFIRCFLHFISLDLVSPIDQSQMVIRGI